MLTRNIIPKIVEALADTPVVMLNGARQTGKSTLAKALVSEKRMGRYVTMDDATTLAAAKHDPTGFIATLGDSAIIDEIQRAPELFLAIKADVDLRRTPGRYLLTGSANVMLLPRLSDSLAGRIEIFTLYPLSQGEFQGVRESFIDVLFSGKPFPLVDVSAQKSPSLLERATRGGYPEAALRGSESRRSAWFGLYITTILQRDIRDIVNVEGLTGMPRLLSMLATRTSTLLNYSELSRTTGFAQSTLKRYMSLFEMIFLTEQLPSWYTNLGKRLVKTPKLIMNDTGLLTTLLGVNTARLEDTPLCGAIIENFIIMEIKKQISWSNTKPMMFHYRTQTGQEVDLLLEDVAGRIVGVEIKSAKSVGANDFRGLHSLQETAGNSFLKGIVLYGGDKIIAFGKNLYALPITLLWSKELESSCE